MLIPGSSFIQFCKRLWLIFERFLRKTKQNRRTSLLVNYMNNCSRSCYTAIKW